MSIIMIRKFVEHKKFQLVNNLCASKPFGLGRGLPFWLGEWRKRETGDRKRELDDYIIYGPRNNTGYGEYYYNEALAGDSWRLSKRERECRRGYIRVKTPGNRQPTSAVTHPSKLQVVYEGNEFIQHCHWTTRCIG